MRHLTGTALAFLLTVLLASTTPVGTGSGTHQFDLLHPLFTHMHLVNGRLLTHEQMQEEALASAPASSTPTRGPSLGSAGGPDGSGLGLSPTMPVPASATFWVTPGAWLLVDMRLPPGREEAPPDPPPLV